MIRAFVLSIGQLGDPAILRVLARSLAVTLAIFVALGVGLYYALDAGVAWATGQQDLAAIVAVATVLIEILAAWLLFRVVAIAVIGVFGDDVVEAVERRHYPQALAGARRVTPIRSVRMGLGSAARAVAVNTLLLPVYVALLFTGVGTPVAFFLVNGWLLARDLGDMVAARHMDDAAMRGWRKASTAPRMATGLATTGLLMVPLVNLVAPVLGAAMATHMFHARTR